MYKLRAFNLLILLFALLIFGGCQKVIDIDVNTSPSQLVIEGGISNVRGIQTVKISRSVAYTSTNVYPAVSGADVKVTDNAGNTYKFTETKPGIYTIASMQGVTNRTYNLQVLVDGSTYTASSTMPAAVKLDSIKITTLELGFDDRKYVAMYYKDPANIKNQYRYVMRVNGIQSNHIYVNDDRFSDGNEIKDVLFPNGNDDDRDKLASGDVEVDYQCVDANVFNFWNTLRNQRSSGPGGGVTPGNPPTNLSNNALGIFSAYVTKTYSITVK
jgi:hypothetical protein